MSWPREQRIEFRDRLRKNLKDLGLEPSLHLKGKGLLYVWLKEGREYTKYAVLGKRNVILQYFGSIKKIFFKQRIKLERLKIVLESHGYETKEYAKL